MKNSALIRAGTVRRPLIGEKRDGGNLTREGIESVSASRERLLGMLVSEAIAQCLMVLQRHRLAEPHNLDYSTRHWLHDVVLLDSHAAIVQLSGHERDEAAVADVVGTSALLSDIHVQIPNLIRVRAGVDKETVTQRGLIVMLREVLEVVVAEFAGACDGITWNVPDDEPCLAPVLFYLAREAVRNVVLHGRIGRCHAEPRIVSQHFRRRTRVTQRDDRHTLGTPCSGIRATDGQRSRDHHPCR